MFWEQKDIFSFLSLTELVDTELGSGDVARYVCSSPVFSDSVVADPVCNTQAWKFQIFIFRFEKLLKFVSNQWQEKISTSCGNVCQWYKAGWCFSLGPPVSSTNKTDHLDMTEILLKVALNTITLAFTIMSGKLILAGSGYPSLFMNSSFMEILKYK